MTGLVLTRPQQTNGGIPGTILTNILVPFAGGSNIVNVDQLSSASNASVKWIYTIMSPTNDKVLTAEVVAIQKAGADPSHNRYSVVGDRGSLPHKIDVKIISSNIVLEMTNLSTTTDYTVNVVRIQMLT